MQLDATLRPVEFFSLNVQGVYQDPKLSNLRFNGVAQPQYDGNTPERTPKKLLTVTPSFVLPGGLGEIYGRYKYIGKIFADSGNGIALPAYGVFSIGASIDATPRLNLSVSVDNLTDVKGFTEAIRVRVRHRRSWMVTSTAARSSAQCAVQRDAEAVRKAGLRLSLGLAVLLGLTGAAPVEHYALREG